MKNFAHVPFSSIEDVPVVKIPVIHCIHFLGKPLYLITWMITSCSIFSKAFSKSSFSEKPSGQFLCLIVMSHWLGDVWIWIRDGSVVLPLSFVRLENHVCLFCGVQVAGATWRAAIKIVAGVGDLVQMTGDGRTGRILSGRAIERSGDTVCGLHRARGDEECGFLGWTSKPTSMIC
jgi:hypothetical protein